MFAELTHKGLAQQLFEDLVAQCQEAGIIDGTHVAIHSAAFYAYEKKEPTPKSYTRSCERWQGGACTHEANRRPIQPPVFHAGCGL